MAGHKGTKRAVKAKGKKVQSQRAVKGAASKTHKGRKDYTTKKGDKDFHRKGHDEKRSAKSKTMRKPYSKSKKGGAIAHKALSHKAAKVSGHKQRPITHNNRGLENQPLVRYRSGERDQKNIFGAIGHFFTSTVPSAARTVGDTVARPVEQYVQGRLSPQGTAQNAAQRVGQIMGEDPASQEALFSGAE